jgi:hypothetical protein
MAGNRISILVALDGADEGLKRAITSAERSLGELATTAKTAGDKAAAGLAEVKAGVSAFGDQVSKARMHLLAFLSISWATGKAQEIIQVADAWNMMSARLKLAISPRYRSFRQRVALTLGPKRDRGPRVGNRQCRWATPAAATLGRRSNQAHPEATTIFTSSVLSVTPSLP